MGSILSKRFIIIAELNHVIEKITIYYNVKDEMNCMCIDILLTKNSCLGEFSIMITVISVFVATELYCYMNVLIVKDGLYRIRLKRILCRRHPFSYC